MGFDAILSGRNILTFLQDVSKFLPEYMGLRLKKMVLLKLSYVLTSSFQRREQDPYCDI
jgi:hypothetical protein